MKLIDKFVSRELLVNVLFAIAVLSLVLVVGNIEGNKLENITVFELDQKSMPMRVTFARTGMLEADLENKRILMHLYNARYQQRDEKDPADLRKIKDGISMSEGTLPISLEELYEKENKRPSRSAMS